MSDRSPLHQIAYVAVMCLFTLVLFFVLFQLHGVRSSLGHIATAQAEQSEHHQHRDEPGHLAQRAQQRLSRHYQQPANDDTEANVTCK